MSNPFFKCLTICQPYPYFIFAAHGELREDHHQKRVENRRWETRFRGPLLIHAGLSRAWLKDWPEIAPDSLTFGALIGMVEMVDCVDFNRYRLGQVRWQRDEDDKHHMPYTKSIDTRYPWFEDHVHAEGPYCFVLEKVRKFPKPIPYTGRQGMFNVPRSVVAEALLEIA